MATTEVSLPELGTAMPDVPLTTVDGSAARLADVTRGTRAVVFFMRASNCQSCIGHARHLVRMQDAGELPGVKVAIVTPGDVDDAQKVARRVPSASAEIYASGHEHAAVGLKMFLLIQHSGTFVLDADGMVLQRRASTMPMGSFDRDGVLAALA